MSRLPLVLLGLALPAVAQEVDAGAPVVEPSPARAEATADGGTPQAHEAHHEGVGRHFAFVWDAEGPRRGSTDVQAWLTPRWGRVETFTAVELRAGFMQGFTNSWAVGVFVDAIPTETGDAHPEAQVDGRLTFISHVGSHLGHGLTLANKVELGLGLHGAELALLLGLDYELGPLLLAIDVEGSTDANLDSGLQLETTRFRQSFGVAYTLANGFSIGVEVQNRLSWQRTDYSGDAFLIGPSLNYRGERFWFVLALLPQVAAVKTQSQRGGDPLELVDNERFSLRLMFGLNAR